MLRSHPLKRRGHVMSNAPTVLIDLDGTLIDPKPGIIGSIQYALQRMGEPVPPAEGLTAAIGPPLRTTFSALVGPERAEEAVAHYRQYYADGAMFDCIVYPGVPAALAQLVREGHRLIVVTAKPHVFARPIVAHLGLDADIAAVYGPELDGTHDNKADLLAHVLAAEKIGPRRAVMVGDRRFDMLAAKANSVAALGVAWGYGSRDELEEAGARIICDAPGDLGPAVSALGLS